MAKWNPRFELYAAAHGRTPEAQAEHDDKTRPGARMLDFIIWMSDRWSEWRKANGRGPYDTLFPEDHARFDKWLGESIHLARAA